MVSYPEELVMLSLDTRGTVVIVINWTWADFQLALPLITLASITMVGELQILLW